MTSLISMDRLELKKRKCFFFLFRKNKWRWYILTSFAVSFLRFIFGGIVVASTEFGGKLVVEIDDGVGVGVELVVELVDDVKIEIGVEVESIDVFEDDERSWLINNLFPLFESWLSRFDESVVDGSGFLYK